MITEPTKASDLERAFETVWAWVGGPDLEFQFRFGRWRFDFAHPVAKVAIEVDGLFRAKGKGRRKGYAGRHITPKGYVGDCKKRNAAHLAGWVVFNLTREMLDDTEHIEEIAAFIRRRAEEAAEGAQAGAKPD